MKTIIKILIVISSLLIGCNNIHQDKPRITYYPNGKVKSIQLGNKEKKSKYYISFTNHGDMDTIYQHSDSPSKQIELAFNKNGGLLSYFNANNYIISNHSIMFDSNSHIDNIGLPAYVVNGYIKNQEIYFYKDGLINSDVSHFILIDVKAIKDSKAQLTIQLIGKRFENIYALIGNYDENYNLNNKSKVDTFYGQGNVVIADVNIKRGSNLFRGLVMDMGSKKGYPVYFTKEIEAK
jgi:hypothetical protein